MSADAGTDQVASMTWRFFSRTRALAWGGIAVVFALGVAALFAMVVEMAGRVDMSTAGPGMWIFNSLNEIGQLGALGRDLLSSLCTVDGNSVFSGNGSAFAPGFLASIFVMWVAMSCAMMLPTAAPMITTYTEIAETARARDIPVVSPLILAGGYLFVWFLFGAMATLGQAVLIHLSQVSPGLVVKNGYLAAGILAAAGLYQFSELKMACLTKCRTPFPFFMANWTDRPGGIFRLGMRQGILCVMCCWALMAVMFVAGLMNVVWMCILALVMLAEKVLPSPKAVSRGVGAILFVWAGGLLAAQVLY